MQSFVAALKDSIRYFWSGIWIIIQNFSTSTENHDQFHLIDRTDKLATEYFIPDAGFDLKGGNHLPAVMAHEFGVWGLGFIEDDFYAEISSHQEVGVIVEAQ